MAIKTNRAGETQMMKNGQRATIVVYRSATNMDIEFEDGTIVQNRAYSEFKKRQIANPNFTPDRTNASLHLNETRVMSNGQKATIIAYRSSTDMDVKFEDGTIREHVRYRHFLNGKVSPMYVEDRKKNDQNKRIGETKMMNCGMKATIIKYENKNDIDVEFEDGVIVRQRRYDNFKRGSIQHPNKKSETLANQRLGEVKMMKNGINAKIIAYRSSQDIDVQFEDESVRCGVRYDVFKSGSVKHPSKMPESLYKQRIGETRVMNNGLKSTIVAYRSERDIDVQFEDGSLRKNRSYSQFKTGTIQHPNKTNDIITKDRLNETKTMSNGQKATIIRYRNCKDIDVKFEDNSVRYGVEYKHFKEGQVRHPDDMSENKRRLRLNETRIMNNGMEATIIEYEKANNITIKFQDGTVIKNVRYDSFKKGWIQNKKK